MDLTPVTCNHCGASLQVTDSTRFVTCRYCNSQLEIKRTDSTISTEVLQRIDQSTASMAEDIHAIRHETELERLDREWAQRQSELLTRNRDGTTSPPSAGGVIAAVIMGIFGLLWTIFAFTITAPNPGFPPSLGPPPIIHIIFPLFGVFFIIFAIAIGIRTASAAGRYQEEQRQYQQRRQQLLARQPAPASDEQ